MKAYHFLKDNMCGGYGKEPPWKVGETRSVEGKLEMCSWGYHASPSWLAALNYAQGGMACIVELSGDILKDENKSVAQTRKLIEARDSSKTLREFACQCAERALKRAKITDERSWEAVKVARLYSKGKATLRELDAAGDAAWDAEVAWQKRTLNKLMRQLFKEEK